MYPCFRLLLRFPGFLYSLVMFVRRKAYEKGLFFSYAPACPCISIGNIRWGGTGKTPLTQWLLQWFVGKGSLPVVLTRGYRARPPAPHYLVEAHSPPEHAGDEPLLLARSCPGAKILVDPRRKRAAAWAWQTFSPDVFLLDDGLQHLAVQRSVNLVLLRPEDITHQWNHVFPAGPWREGPLALQTASAFLIKCPPEEFTTLQTRIEQRLHAYKVPVFQFVPEAEKFIPAGRSPSERITGDMAGTQPYLLVSGVNEPEQVRHTATDLAGSPPADHLIFPNHHAYTAQDWDTISQHAQKTGSRHIVCTQKDAVKLARFQPDMLWAIEINLRFTHSLFYPHPFPQWWEAHWQEQVQRCRR